MVCSYNLINTRKPSLLVYTALAPILVPDKLIKGGEGDILDSLYTTGMVNKACAELTRMLKGVHESSGCARHRSVYVYCKRV